MNEVVSNLSLFSQLPLEELQACPHTSICPKAGDGTRHTWLLAELGPALASVASL